MKKVFLSAIAVCAFGMANAQDLKFGVRAGSNFSTLTGDAVADDVKMQVGFNAGGLMEIKFTDMISLQPEVLFSMQGAKTSDTDNNGITLTEDESKINLSYINVPVMFKLYPVKGFYLEAGPQVGFLVDAKSKDETRTVTGGVETSESTTTDIKGNLKTVDFSFNGGLGFDFTENLFINARYSFGLTNVYDAPAFLGVFGITDLDAKNSVISLNLGYKF
jgi:Outer membrane protein beta-barrel domain